MATLSTTSRGKARRAQILDVARECFLRDGFHATSMQDLLRATGLSAGAFYRYYHSKESIVVALAKIALTEIASVLNAGTAADSQPLREVLCRAIHALERADIRNGTSRMAVQIWGEAQRNPKLLKVVAEATGAVVKWLENVVVAQQARGELPASVSPQKMARVLAGLLQGFMVQRALFGARAADYCDGLTVLTLRPGS